MGWLKIVWTEFIGLFVDDGSLAVAVLLWLAVGWLLAWLGLAASPGLPPALPPVILVAGLVLILTESTLRFARKRL